MTTPPIMLDYAPARRTRYPPPRLWIHLLVTFSILYLPYSWILWVGKWDNVRIAWLKLWPVLPGLWTMMFGRTPFEIWLMGIATLATVAIIVVIGRYNRPAFVITSFLALGGSLANSWLAYQLWLF